jgi:hypothetical protein
MIGMGGFSGRRQREQRELAPLARPDRPPERKARVVAAEDQQVTLVDAGVVQRSESSP